VSPTNCKETGVLFLGQTDPPADNGTQLQARSRSVVSVHLVVRRLNILPECRHHHAVALGALLSRVLWMRRFKDVVDLHFHCRASASLLVLSKPAQ